jgi:hypothetical protein
MELKDRERKIDVEKLSIDQADALSAQIGVAIGKIMDEANLKCNQLLNIYGLQTQISYNILKIGEKSQKTRKSKKAPKA